ncbi:MAG: hypothetical protein U1C96_05035 [Gallionella sp.]|nr:hypothetical protein [Gallionella sp.]
MTSNTQPNSDLPVLTQVINDDSADGLPVLTDVVDTASNSTESLGETGMKELQQQLETYMETVLTQTLRSLQQQATERALTEFKAALPELLRNARNNTAKQ